MMQRRAAYGSLFLCLGVLLTAGITTALWGKWRAHPVIAYAIAVSGVTLVLYAYDKLAAKWRWRERVPERVLHFFAAMGGSPAALLGQSLFRHKTVKRSFRLVFWVIVAAQITAAVAAWVYWGTDGAP